jgi:SAM-dependent methyltransferase
VVGEAGAGDGYFTFPMARRVGPAGVVLANDISTRALSSLDRRRASEQAANIQTVAGAVDDPRFPRHDLQLIVIVHAFHDFLRPVEWLVNAKKYLRPGATLAIIDRDPAQGAEAHFWPRERIAGYARDAGFVLVKAVDVSSAHLVLVFTPQARPMQTPGEATIMTDGQRAKLDTFLKRAVDDRRPELMSVIVRVSAGEGAGARLGELLTTRGLKVGSTLSDGRLVVVTLTADHLPALAASPDIAHISFDAFVKPLAR